MSELFKSLLPGKYNISSSQYIGKGSFVGHIVFHLPGNAQNKLQGLVIKIAPC